MQSFACYIQAALSKDCSPEAALHGRIPSFQQHRGNSIFSTDLVLGCAPRDTPSSHKTRAHVKDALELVLQRSQRSKYAFQTLAPASTRCKICMVSRPLMRAHISLKTLSFTTMVRTLCRWRLLHYTGYYFGAMCGEKLWQRSS